MNLRRAIHLTLFCMILISFLFAPDFRSGASGSSAGFVAAATNFDHRHLTFRFSRIDFPGATATNPGAINAHGDIVGNYHDSADTVHGFLLQEGTFSTIDFPDASFTSARGINARGDIVGRVSGAGGDEHGFLLRDGNFIQIDFPGASATTARGINNDGDITGRHFDVFGNESGFIQKDGTYHDIFGPGSCSTDVWMTQDNERAGRRHMHRRRQWDPWLHSQQGR